MIDNDPQNIKARAALLDGCAKAEAERRKPVVSEVCFAAVRETNGREWLDCVHTLEFHPNGVRRAIEKTAKMIPAWHRDNPLQRIVKVRIEEVIE